MHRPGMLRPFVFSSPLPSLSQSSTFFNCYRWPRGYHQQNRTNFKNPSILNQIQVPVPSPLLSSHVKNFSWSYIDDESIFQRLRRRLGFPKTETKKYILRGSGQFLFIKVADEVNYTKFFEVCDMEDTFASWFAVMELHIWLLSCRLMEDGEDGRVTRNALLKAMWRDVDMRSKKLEGALPSARRLQVADLGYQFNTQLISYDEGLLRSDIVLAGALWRRFLREQPITSQDDFRKQILALELLLAFARSQFAQLHSLSKKDVLDCKFKWIPLDKSILALQP